MNEDTHLTEHLQSHFKSLFKKEDNHELRHYKVFEPDLLVWETLRLAIYNSDYVLRVETFIRQLSKFETDCSKKCAENCKGYPHLGDNVLQMIDRV